MANARQFIEHIQTHRILFAFVTLSVLVFLILPQLSNNSVTNTFRVGAIDQFKQSYYEKFPPVNQSNRVWIRPDKYAVFCSNTPNGESYRSYDYAYNLPLTALAWERLGFRSIVMIIGSRCEWENDPALKLVLAYLDARRAVTIFINSPLDYRATLSQTARLFPFNFPEFPGKDSDYLITSDSDLWPLRKEHYDPRPDYDIIFVHAGCCGQFTMNNRTYQMVAMSNVGATVSVWKQIMNEGHPLAYDTESILDYFTEMFGDMARSPVVVGKETWYMDQRMLSVRMAEWLDKHGNSTTYRVSDREFKRVDRTGWDADKLVPETLAYRFDAHLPGKGFLPNQWNRIKPLVNLMYGNDSWEARWCEEYTQEFLSKVVNFVRFTDLG